MVRRPKNVLHRLAPDAQVELRVYTHCPFCQQYLDRLLWQGPVADLRAGRAVLQSPVRLVCCNQPVVPQYFKVTWQQRLVAVGPVSMILSDLSNG